MPYRYDQGRVAVRPVRSGASGSATHTATRWRACWVARRTLPLGVERAVSVRSGASGSASGTLGGSGGTSHTATRCRACRIGTIRGEWQCDRYDQDRVAVLAGRDGLRTRSRHADWRVAQLGKCARATARQAAGAGCAEARRPWPGARPHGKAQSEQRASLMARPRPGRDTIRLPVMDSGGAGNSG